MRKGQAPFIWTEARQAELRRLTALNYTAQRAADALGTSRYAVEYAKTRYHVQNTTLAELETVNGRRREISSDPQNRRDARR